MLPELMPLRTFSPAPIISRSRGPQRMLAGERSAAGIDGVVGVRYRSAPKRHDRVANEFVDCAPVAVDLARHNIEILGEQRNDLIAKPFGQSGKAGNVR